MSLVKCHECQREVSEIADVCPGCGAPVISEVKTHVLGVMNYRAVSGILFFGSIAWLVMAAYVGGPDELSRDFAWIRWVMGAGALYYILGEIGRNLDERKMRRRRGP